MRARRRLGDVLLDHGALSAQQLRQALAQQSATGNRLATECRERGLADERSLLVALASQTGVPGLALEQLEIADLECVALMPESVALEHEALVVGGDSERVIVALADPAQSALLDEFAFRWRRQVMPCVALHGPLLSTIKLVCAAKKKGEVRFQAMRGASDITSSSKAGDRGASDRDAMGLELIRPPELPQAGPPRVTGSALPSQTEASLVDELLAIDEIPVVAAGNLDDRDVVVESESRSSLLEVDQASGQVPDSRTSGSRSSASRVTPSKSDVLVVDDDADLSKLIARLLRSRGLSVEESPRGLHALSRVREQPPRLLILDALLPEVHGFDIAYKLKSSERYRHIPIIMISSVYRGWRIAEDVKTSYGVEAFLEKPFKLSTLWTTVQQVLAHRTTTSPGQRRMAASAYDTYHQSLALLKEGCLSDAIEKLKEGIRIDPLSAKLQLQLGVLYLRQRGAVYQAITALESAVQLEPRLFSALHTLAALYQRKGFKNKAIDLWEQALACCPDEETADRIRKHLLTLL